MNAVSLLSLEFAGQLECSKVEDFLRLLPAADVLVRHVDGNLPLAGGQAVLAIVVNVESRKYKFIFPPYFGSIEVSSSA